MVVKEQAREEIRKLVERYRKESQDSAFVKNESQVCNSLILPFFRNVFGWDTETQFKTEYAQSGKRMDYLVHIDGISQFVIEAKSLSQEIVDNRNFYEQVIHYARQKERRFCVLTNFRHWIVLDANIETAPLKAAIAVIDIETLSDADFEVLWSFQREVWEEKGEANETLLKLKGKQKKKISEELLDDVKKWREQLLTNIKKHPRLNNFDFASDMEKIEGEVQRFIDRLIFICYCEDRQLKDPQLKAIVHEKNGDKWDAAGYVLKRIQGLFQDYRATFNSDLFVAGWCDGFHIDDVVLVDIINGLKAPADRLPYDFGIIETDILGKVYENFLGHVLSGRKKLKEKQSWGKRKEEGIYYTPDYIVEYIVKNTLGELLKERELADLQKIRILDPACGSGSFLTKAFAMMDATYKKKNPTYSTAFMKNQILKNNVFGVDLDSRAVEMSRFHLMLRAAERKQKLPELKGNIKCGNSLIDDPAVAGDKAFKWEEQFGQVMGEGGFDVIIGNPPYLLMQPQNTPINELNYFKAKFKAVQYKIDSYHLFFERSIALLKDGGYFGFITPNTYLTNIYISNLRKYILNNCKVVKIIIIPKEVFPDASVDAAITILQKERDERKRKANKIGVIKIRDFSNGFDKTRMILQNEFFESRNNIFNVQEFVIENDLFRKITKDTIQLGEIARISFGLQTKDKETYVKKKPLNKKWKPCIDGRDISEFNVRFNSKYVLHDIKVKAGGCWDESTHNIPEKIVVRQIGITPIAALDVKRFYCLNTIYNITSLKDGFSYRYLLALINSDLIKFFWRAKFYDSKLLFPKVKKAYLDQIPVKKATIEEQQTFIASADKMLSLNKRLTEIGAKKTVERERIEEEIKKTDAEIDELVYKLYGITEEEKKIIEDELKRS